MRTDFKRRAADALATSDPTKALRDVVRGELRDGTSGDDLVTVLQSMRATLSEQDENSVLDVMDALVGWCSPHERLDDDA